MWTGWLIGLLGIWTIITPFVGFSPRGNAWNDWIVGVVVAILGFASVAERPWQSWLAGLVGVWFFIAGFIPALHYGIGVYWNDIPTGVVLAILGFAAAGSRRPAQTTTTPPPPPSGPVV